MSSTVTLIIPTVSRRASLFARTLFYLSEVGFNGDIIVSDHSLPADADAIPKIAEPYRNLSLRLLKHDPDAHFLDRLVQCAAEAHSKYVHLHADDDFLIMPTLEHLVRALETSSGCVAAMGININFSLTKRQIRPIGKTAVAQQNPFERLIAQLENYSSVLYALRLREEFIETLSYTYPRCPDVQFWQYLESCVAAIKGGFVVLDDLHYVRSLHLEKWSATLVREKSRDHFPYLILSDQFHPRLLRFRAALVNACGESGTNVDDSMLDAALTQLLFRGLGAMGLPRHTPEAVPSHEDIIDAKLRDRTSPVTAQLTYLCELADRHARSVKSGH